MRQLSGVRGCPYAWASSRRLQAALADAGIGYEDDLELALTTELHHLHRAEDFQRGVSKRSRCKLASERALRFLLGIHLPQFGMLLI